LRRIDEPAASLRLAGPGQRLVAWMLDAAFSGVLILPLVPLAVLIDQDDRPWALTAVAMAFLSIAAFVLLVHFDGGQRGATPGKRLLGIRVVDAAGSGPIGHRRAALRRLVYVLGGLLLYLGWLWLLVDRHRQTWHDKAAHTVVLRTR
jgi:uncharacterized RDD family membrane protein YckC